jgi:hypothetical protein
MSRLPEWVLHSVWSNPETMKSLQGGCRPKNESRVVYRRLFRATRCRIAESQNPSFREGDLSSVEPLPHGPRGFKLLRKVVLAEGPQMIDEFLKFWIGSEIFCMCQESDQVCALRSRKLLQKTCKGLGALDSINYRFIVQIIRGICVPVCVLANCTTRRPTSASWFFAKEGRIMMNSYPS